MKKKSCPRCQALEQIIIDIAWMARRYAMNRNSYAPHSYNDSMKRARKLNVPTNPDPIEDPPTYWAKDGTYGWPIEYWEERLK